MGVNLPLVFRPDPGSDQILRTRSWSKTTGADLWPDLDLQPCLWLTQYITCISMYDIYIYICFSVNIKWTANFYFIFIFIIWNVYQFINMPQVFLGNYQLGCRKQYFRIHFVDILSNEKDLKSAFWQIFRRFRESRHDFIRERVKLDTILNIWCARSDCSGCGKYV